MREAFWRIMSATLPLLVLLFVANAVLLVLLVLSVPFLDVGSASYYLSVLSGGVILTSLVGLGYAIRKCKQR